MSESATFRYPGNNLTKFREILGYMVEELPIRVHIRPFKKGVCAYSTLGSYSDLLTSIHYYLEIQVCRANGAELSYQDFCFKHAANDKHDYVQSIRDMAEQVKSFIQEKFPGILVLVLN